jgi:hypothetical protein
MLFNKIPMGITLGDVAFNQDVKCIRPKQQLVPLFLFQWLHAKENTIQNKSRLQVLVLENWILLTYKTLSYITILRRTNQNRYFSFCCG